MIVTAMIVLVTSTISDTTIMVCDQGGKAERKSCESECGFLIPYIILQFLGIFMTFLATMPSVVASLRAVHPEERSLALGLQSMILRFSLLDA